MTNDINFGPEGCFGNFGSFGSFGSFGQNPGNPPLVVNALTTNHDGIAGNWIPVPAADVGANDPEEAAYLGRLAPGVRASIFSQGIGSRIGFSYDTSVNVAEVFHLETAPANPPSTIYRPLMKMSRPTQNTFAAQLDLVVNYADLRPDRASEVIAQLGTPTEFLRAIAFVQPDRTLYTIELLGMGAGGMPDTSRVAFFWNMDGEPGGGPPATFGRKWSKPEIDVLLQKNLHAGLLDEPTFYRDLGLINWTRNRFAPSAMRISHGTHVMGLCAGFVPRPGWPETTHHCCATADARCGQHRRQ